MHNQHEYDKTLHQSSSHTRREERKTNAIITNDTTGNATFDTGEPDRTNVGTGLLSSTQAITLSQGLIDNLVETSEKLNDNLTETLFTGTNPLANGLSTVSPELESSCSAAVSSSDNHISIQSENKLPLQSDFLACGDKESKSVKASNFYNTGFLCAQSHLQEEKPSNIYGAVGDCPLSIFGSWALQSQPVNMQPLRDYEVPNDLREARENRSCLPKNVAVDQSALKREQANEPTARRTNTNSGRQWEFNASAETNFHIRVSHVVKLMCMLVLVVAVFSVAFHSRIRTLEEEKKALLGELGDVKMHVQLLVKRMEDVVSLAIPARSQQKYGMVSETDEQMDSTDTGFNSVPIGNNYPRQSTRKIVKRSAAAGRTTKELLYPSESEGINGLNNETTSFGSKMDDWTVDSGRPPKGNRMRNFSPKKFIRRLLRQELRKVRTAHRLETKDLKQKLKQAQQQTFSANLSCCNDTSPNAPSSSAQSACGHQQSQAVYLQIDGSSVHIKKQRQLIGPWFLPSNGNDIGFNGMWYDQLALDSNGTSVIFQEDGLYLISAQVFYQLQHLHNAKPTPMGYRVYLKKRVNEGNAFRRPLTIAECVPSFPTTVYQTCFTQVAWYIEAQDELYLEHFTDSLPMIEALRSGQTFLGLVRLN